MQIGNGKIEKTCVGKSSRERKKICQKTEEKERRSAFNEIEAFVLSSFRRKKIRIFIYFFKIMLTWKIVGVLEASVLYIHIDN